LYHDARIHERQVISSRHANVTIRRGAILWMARL